MKTQILTIFTALVLSTGIASTTYAATAKTQNVTVLKDVPSISKIEVHGNVELYVSDGDADQVKVYNKYYSEGALVQNKDGVLRISSYTAEKLVVWVTANDLRAVSAYDNAEVKSFGDLSKIDFNVELHNSATAKLNLDAYAATISVNDKAKADLSGKVEELSLNKSAASIVSQNNFAAAHITENKSNAPVRSEIDEIAGL